jgi:hypothetical protein
MNAETTNVDIAQKSIRHRIAYLSNQTDQLTNTVFNKYMHKTPKCVHMDLTCGMPVEFAKADHTTTGTQTSFFFAPEASHIDVSIVYAGTWFFIQNQVWCLLENLVPVQIQDVRAFTSALGGMLHGVKCVGLARLLGHKNTPRGNNDTYIRAVMVTAGEIIILPSAYTLQYNTLHPREKYNSSR